MHIGSAQKPNSVHYKIYETNADLEALKFIYGNYHRDIAETKLWNLFKESDYEKDFYVINADTLDIVSYIFSAKTAKNRGECQG